MTLGLKLLTANTFGLDWPVLANHFEWVNEKGEPRVRPAHVSRQPSEGLSYLGMITVSITWITPLLASMSVLTTLALSTVTPPIVAIVNSEP